MSNSVASVGHDHDYCATLTQDEKDINSVVENLLNSTPLKPMDGEPKDLDSFCLSPAYSCDSGIDSFANDLVNGFGGEGDDLLNFLFDDDFQLDSELQESMNSTNFVKTAKVDERSTKMAKQPKAPIGKKATVDEFEKSRKNAENARENRRKKKAYVEGLEKEVGQLRNEKNVLMGKSNKLEAKVNKLENEVDYLKSILANQSMLSKLIENVSKTPGISLSTSFCSSRESSLKADKGLLQDNDIEGEKENTVATRSSSRKRVSDSQPATSAKRGRGSSSGGVCLHVRQSKVSLEFCSHCSKMAED